MTIDEAISHAREKAKEMYLQGMLCHANPNDDKLDGCIECGREHEQLAEWLEDYKRLKSIPEHTYENCHNLTCRRKCEKDGYNKAIDDYMNKLCNHCMQQTNECYKPECPFCTDGCDVVNIAEKMKAGGKNGCRS